MRIDRLAAPQLSETWSLSEDVKVCEDAAVGGLVLSSHWGEQHIPAPGPVLAEALRRMALGPVSLRNVLPDFPDYDTPLDQCGLQARRLLGQLAELQFLVGRTLSVGAAPLLSVVSLVRDVAFRPEPLAPGPDRRRVELVPQARLRRRDGTMCLERPDGDHRVQLHRPEAVWLVARLQGLRVDGLPTAARLDELGLPDEVAPAALAYLTASGMAVLK